MITKHQWGFQLVREKETIFLHRGIDGSYIIKSGSLNHSDPVFEGDYDGVVNYLQRLSVVSTDALNLLTLLAKSEWETIHGRYFLKDNA